MKDYELPTLAERADIVERANSRGFTFSGHPAVLAGYNLPYPRVHVKGFTSGGAEVSWYLAERLASGETTNVNG